MEEDDLLLEVWLVDIAEDESVLEASVADDNDVGSAIVEDDTIEDGMLEDDNVELEATLLDERVPVDVIMVEAVEGTLLEAMVELRIDDESDDDTLEVEDAADDAPVEDGVMEDTAVDDNLAEDTSVVADPLEMAEEAELATVEETEDMVDAAEDESDDWT